MGLRVPLTCAVLLEVLYKFTDTIQYNRSKSKDRNGANEEAETERQTARPTERDTKTETDERSISTDYRHKSTDLPCDWCCPFPVPVHCRFARPPPSGSAALCRREPSSCALRPPEPQWPELDRRGRPGRIPRPRDVDKDPAGRCSVRTTVHPSGPPGS